VARPPDPGIRKALRDQAVDYVLTHGITDLALRPLAKALHTNARMLVYHFGSREGLMREILEGLREREDTQIQSWFETGKRPNTLSEFLRWYWGRVSVPGARPSARLIFELYALALRNPLDYPGVLEAPLQYWKRLAAKTRLASKLRASEATLLLAAFRGLVLDFAATGDRIRTEGAIKVLAQFVESQETRSRKKARLTR
jgi:AcrR family transcriptional regulator